MLRSCFRLVVPAPGARVRPSIADLVVRAGAPLFEGMGDYHRPIKTRDPGAQRYFDQGMVLAFGFNHAEAIRSFRAAQKLDPQCAMCFWGEALATGPNINVTSKGKAIMSPADRKAAYAAAQRAVALQGHASAVERALIEALATRYDGSETSDRDPQDRAYAAAMKSVVEQFPEDDDAAAIYAEAWMNTMPWDYWSADGAPKPETVEVLERSRTDHRALTAASARAASVHPRHRGLEESRACREGCGHAGHAGSGLRPSRPHAGTHLLARRALPRRLGSQREGGRRR